MAAGDFCRLIETHRKMSRQTFLMRIIVVLPRLYASALDLPPIDSKGTYEERRLTSKEWQILFKSLGRKLGRYSRYWEIFNPYVRDDVVASSLADDLADIYGDIKPGLQMYNQGPRGARNTAIWTWSVLLIYHWGHHATQALRALQQLHSEWRLTE